MRGIILAGGTGSRLWPMTLAVSKQLIPVYDKPMIYYPLTTLISMGIRDILVITTLQDKTQFQNLLGSGAQWGMNISYKVQMQPRGIAEALILGDEFIGDEDVALILGDNIFHTNNLGIRSTNTIFVTPVADNSRYGVLFPDPDNKDRYWISEKPRNAPAHYPAVTGLYVYTNGAHKLARALEPSLRGELEITDLNNLLLCEGDMHVARLPKPSAWLDTGTVEDLHNATEYVRVLEQRQGIKIGCPEEAAWLRGWIGDDELFKLGEDLRNNEYAQYLQQQREFYSAMNSYN